MNTSNDILDDDIDNMFNDIYNIENNINILDIFIILVNNNNIAENIILKKKSIENNLLNKSELYDIINKINEIDYENKYNIEYVLKFLINDDIKNIYNNTNINSNLEIIKSIDNIYFNNKFKDTNAIFLIFKEKDKIHYITKVKYPKNKTKKNKLKFNIYK